jgi:hypothetical protein
MKEVRLPLETERELLALLIQADRSDDVMVSIPGESGPTVAPHRKIFTLAAVVKSIQFIAAIPLVAIVGILYLTIWLPIFVIANAVRFGFAKIKGRTFKIEWYIFFGAGGMVDSVGQLKIEIFPNDHNPPHFHVKTERYNAKFDIETCELLGGTGVPGKHIRVIKDWHANSVENVQVSESLNHASNNAILKCFRGGWRN